MQPLKSLPVPTRCDNCSSDRMGLTSKSVIYGKEYGPWPYCYYCDDCGAYVGCHPNTYTPMGFMANSQVRRLRAKLHQMLDPIWHLKYLSRSQTYNWLASQLNILESDCHISQLNQSQLERALYILNPHSLNNYIQFQKRKIKNDNRKSARFSRENSRIGRRKSGK